MPRAPSAPSAPPAGARLGRPAAALITVLVLAGTTLLHPPGSEYDFCTYYTAGLLAREGRPADAYDVELLNRRHDRLHATEREYGAFLYSPVLLLPAAAISLLPFPAAEALNELLLLLSLGCGLYLALRAARRPATRLLVCLAYLLAHVVAVQFLYQNWSFLLLPAVALGWRATRAGRPWAAAAGWALALHLKVYTAPLVVAAWVAGRRPAAHRALGLSVALAAAAWPLAGAASWGRFAGGAAELSSAGILPFHNKISLGAAVARHLSPPVEWFRPTAPVDHWLVHLATWGWLPLLAAFLWWRRSDLERLLAGTLPLLLLAVPMAWEHTAVVLLLLLATPALGERRRQLLALLLAASFPFRAVVGRLATRVVAGGGGEAALEALLGLYPLLSLLALLLVVVPARRRPVATRPR